MKYILFLLLFVNISVYASQCETVDSCDKQINSLNKEIISGYKDSPLLLKRYLNTQQNWVKYYQSVFLQEYPPEHPYSASVYCTDEEYIEMARQRIRIMKAYVKEPVEGELCLLWG